MINDKRMANTPPTTPPTIAPIGGFEDECAYEVTMLAGDTVCEDREDAISVMVLAGEVLPAVVEVIAVDVGWLVPADCGLALLAVGAKIDEVVDVMMRPELAVGEL